MRRFGGSTLILYLSFAVARESDAQALPPVPPPKCGTALRFQIYEEGRSMAAGKEILARIARPVRQKNRAIAGGSFRVHYDTTGIHEPALLSAAGSRLPGTYEAFVDSVLSALEWSREVIVDELGYLEPPPDTAGVDPLYDVYIEALPDDLFGETAFEPVSLSGAQSIRIATWQVLDNDFATQRTKGLGGMRVTAAHEYFHAVQLGSYGVWGTQEFYWYELSSVWMEERSFPGVDDYIFDLGTYFRNFRTTSFAARTTQYGGYERALFAFYLTERFGEETLRGVWERLRDVRVLTALHGSLEERGSTMRNAFGEFGIWNFFTADRADSSRSYRFGWKYPRLEPVASVSFANLSTSLQYTFGPLSQGLFEFRTESDTLFALLVNVDEAGALSNPSGQSSARLVLSRGDQSLPHQKLESGFTAGMEVENGRAWDVEYFSSERVDIVARTERRPSPNPWKLSEGELLYLPVPATVGTVVSVYFLDSSFESHFAGDFAVESVKGGTAVRIGARTVSGLLSSGAYVVIVRTPAGESLSKVAVIR